MVLLIPAYQPDRRLLELVRELAEVAPELDVVIVDDGSGPHYAPVFSDAATLGADVIGFTANRGKGAALKHGFAHIAAHYPGQDVVCADSDGQHTVCATSSGSDAPSGRGRWCSASGPSAAGCRCAAGSATP